MTLVCKQKKTECLCGQLETLNYLETIQAHKNQKDFWIILNTGSKLAKEMTSRGRGNSSGLCSGIKSAHKSKLAMK